MIDTLLRVYSIEVIVGTSESADNLITSPVYTQGPFKVLWWEEESKVDKNDVVEKCKRALMKRCAWVKVIAVHREIELEVWSMIEARERLNAIRERR